LDRISDVVRGRNSKASESSGSGEGEAVSTNISERLIVEQSGNHEGLISSDKEARSNLQAFLNRTGQIDISELIRVLERSFGCTYNPSRGDGSHSGILRTLEVASGRTESYMATFSKDKRDMEYVESGVLYAALTTLRIPLTEFIKALKDDRGYSSDNTSTPLT
jgi:hypothetical protein